MTNPRTTTKRIYLGEYTMEVTNKQERKLDITVIYVYVPTLEQAHHKSTSA